MEENHVINWDKAIVVDREAQRQTKWIKEAVWIRKTPMCMNRDAGSYQLSHTWDQVISRSREPSSCKQSRCDRDVRRTSKPGVISRGNAWERRSHCWKASGTHGNGVPIVKVFTNAQERNAAVERQRNFVLSHKRLPSLHCFTKGRWWLATCAQSSVWMSSSSRSRRGR